jgi:copper chaperone NosL
MPRRARWLVVAAVLCLIAAEALPLWEVRLVAPQYPEGLGLLIRANTVTGIKPNDLGSINGLNHYIGMKAIEPDAIPELRWMPWILVGLALGGLVVAATASRRLLFAWLGAFLLLGGAGIWDFHRWEYDYGHNLDMANAIIVVPGMNYQPPLIGSKQLLNFTATSWPASGACALGLAFLLAAAASQAGESRDLFHRRVRPRAVLAGGVA